ncbi:MAG TPA: ROK family protein [Arenicellales bacterium]|nr:ROK family protein [Arenicellales bacterium]
MHAIGIDLGGTKTEGLLLAPDGQALERRRVATPAAGGYRAIIAALRDLALDLEARAGAPCRVGVCTPGAISARTGRLKNSNTTCLNGRDIKRDLESALERPVMIENDANCFALSEAVDGAGRHHSVVFGVIMGTGVGGGLVVDRRLHSGRQHIAGEWGHNILEADGPLCYCGKRGCVEVFLSGPGLLADWPDPRSRPAGVPELLERERRGDPVAIAVMDRFYRRFGSALSTVVNILDPDVIVLGGGLSNLDGLYTRGVDALADCVFNDELATPVLKNRHGDSSGVRGAAWLHAAAARQARDGNSGVRK